MKKLKLLCALITVLCVGVGMEKRVSATESDDVFWEYMQENSGYDEVEKQQMDNYTLINIGSVDDVTVYYGTTAEVVKKKMDVTIADTTFHLTKQLSPYAFGIYIVKGNQAYTLEEAYHGEIINNSEFWDVIVEVTVKLREFGMKPIWSSMSGEGTAPVGEPYVMKKKMTLKAGKVKTIANADIVLRWKSTNPKVAKVKDGKLIALKKGTTTIKAYYAKKKYVTSKVTVVSNPKLTKNGKKVQSVRVKKDEIVVVNIKGKASVVANKYVNTKKAKVVSKRNASKIKILGLKKGKTVLKIKVNGSKVIRLKVKVI